MFSYLIYFGTIFSCKQLTKILLIMKAKFYLTILATTLLFVSCERELFDRVRGVGPVITEERHVPSLKDVSLSIPAEVYLYQGDNEELVIDAQANILDIIETEVRGKELKIKFQNGIGVSRHEKIKVYITSPDFSRIHITGSGDIYNETPIVTSTMDLKISGSGSIFLNDVETDVLEASISGSGNITVIGNCHDQYLRISGSGDIHNFEMISEETEVQISGSGETEIFTDDYLYAKISGSGKVFYKGNPIVESVISGSGGVYPAR